MYRKCPASPSAFFFAFVLEARCEPICRLTGDARVSMACLDRENLGRACRFRGQE